VEHTPTVSPIISIESDSEVLEVPVKSKPFRPERKEERREQAAVKAAEARAKTRAVRAETRERAKERRAGTHGVVQAKRGRSARS